MIWLEIFDRNLEEDDRGCYKNNIKIIKK